MIWKPLHTKLVLEGTDPQTQVVVETEGDLERVRWLVKHELPYGQLLYFGGVAPLVEAQARAEKAAGLVAAMVEASINFAGREVPSDKIDLVGDGAYGCLLCGEGHGSVCLHTAEEVRAAFRLLQRFGFRPDPREHPIR